MKKSPSPSATNRPIAIIGIGCLFPQASGLKAYWRLLRQGIDAITDVPDSHWSIDDYFDEDPLAEDKVYCTRGGFLSPVDFDPTEYGIPPNTLEATDTSQLLGLVAAKAALDDAGYGETGRSFNRDRTSVVLGVTGTQELVIPLGARLDHPKWRKALKAADVPTDKAEEVVRHLSANYVDWQENSFPGLLGNVVAGRICNRLDLGGTNCVVDAACASSMSAIHLATLELAAGRSDMVLTGGVDTLNDIFMHMCFGSTGILSPTGDVRPFSEKADGTLLGEGVGIIVLKRLEDAENDKDRIYAVIRAVGTSSDGRSQSIYAPRKEGQVKALTNAYELANIDPKTIDLIEAHGTGTRVGDQTEFQTLTDVFSNLEGEKETGGNRCALGAVKSMIGHTKAAAGTAGLIKTALALHHKTIPPTLKADSPDPDLKIDQSPFYLNTTSRPWLSPSEHPRRSGVSAFGFGGSNFHVVLEEYQTQKPETAWDGSVEIVALSADSVDELVKRLSDWAKRSVEALTREAFSTLAAESRKVFDVSSPCRLLWVCDNLDDLHTEITSMVDTATAALKTDDTPPEKWNNGAIFFGTGSFDGKLSFVFPGQGSQYVNMGRDLMCLFPEALESLEQFNRIYDNGQRLNDYIYPPPDNDKNTKALQEEQLRSTDVAQPAIGAVSLGMLDILEEFSVSPESVCGHSYGELPALLAGGWLDPEGLYKASIARGKLMAEAGNNAAGDPGTMLAVKADLSKLDDLVSNLDSDVILANRNSPSQGVLSGSTPGIDTAIKKCREAKFRAIPLPVAAAFHSRLVADAQKPFRHVLQDIDITPTQIPVFSNTTGNAYPADPEAARDLLGNQLINPVDYVANIQNQYDAGCRTFVEVGPKTVLTGLIRQILRKKDHTVMAMDASGGKKSGLTDLAKCLSHLAALGYHVKLDNWETPPPKGVPRKPIMVIPVGGSNISNPSPSNRAAGNRSQNKGLAKKDHSVNANDINISGKNIQKPISKTNATPLLKKDHMTKHQTNKPGGPAIIENSGPPIQELTGKAVTHTLGVIGEGLKSMREIQARTAKAHELFLETQAEAGRILESLLLRTRDIAQTTDVINAPASPDTTVKNWHSKMAPTPGEKGVASASVPPVSPSAPPSISNEHLSDPITPDQDTALLPTTPKPATNVADALYEVISELTGYPSEMLTLEMNIEADLGIDSIKRVEILSTMEERMPQLPTISPEDMGELKTLGQIATYLNKGNIHLETEPSGVHLEKSVDSEDETPATSPSSGEIDPSGVTQVLFDVISELTGYPVEMLKPEMAIEADLGIDSIKRVEILSTMEERMPQLPTISPEDMGEQKTLGQIIGYLTQETGRPHQDPQVEDTCCEIPDEDASKTIISRQIVTPEVVKTTATLERPEHSGATIVITDDGETLTKALASVFSGMGFTVVILPLASNLSDLDVEHIESNNRDAIDKIDGPIGGFIPLLPRDIPVEMADIKNLFSLTREIGLRWHQAKTETAPFLVGISRMDGAFGFIGGELRHPLHGALPGLLKTAAMEWPHVRCHAIDVAAIWTDHDVISQRILQMALDSDSRLPVEIGLHPDLATDEQYQLRMTDIDYPKQASALVAEDVIVVSGGARGITAECVIALARETGGSFALLGRSSQPTPLPGWLEDLTTPAEVKKAILIHEFQEKTPSPNELNRAYDCHSANREIQRTLRTLNDVGVTARYYSVDVTQADQVDHALEQIRSDLGPITGMIHGAGILRDSLIIDKKMAAFEAVFDTKVLGIQNLLNATRKDPLRHLTLFSSVTARFGNSGQSDYAMANEVLNKIAQVEAKNKTHCAVTAVNWGPWDCGMVSPALKRHFEERGVGLIPTRTGAECLASEMASTDQGLVEVIIGCRIDQDTPQFEQPTLTEEAPSTAGENLSLSFRREVDLNRYPILYSHVLDGHPVVPFALMTEWFGHGALHENPGLVLHGIDDMRLLKGIQMDDDTKMIRLLAGKAKRQQDCYEVTVELRDGVKDNVDVIHSRGRAILVESLKPAPPFDIPPAIIASPYSRSIEEIYETILFHGKHLHGLKKIIGLNDKGMVAEIGTAPQPKEWMAEPLRSDWLADPLAIDTAFQMASLWCYEQKGMVSLPSYTASYRQFVRRFPSKALKVILEVRDTTSHKMTGDFTFIDCNHIVVAQLRGHEAVMDPSLFRSFKPHLNQNRDASKGRNAA